MFIQFFDKFIWIGFYKPGTLSSIHKRDESTMILVLIE